MKKIFAAIAMLLIAFSSYAIDMKKYQIKSGIVEYKITGTQQGTQTLYFDNWGLLTAEFMEVTTKMMGITMRSSTLNLTDKDWTYNINLDDKTGTKISNKELQELMNSTNKKDLEELGRKMLEKLGGRKLNNETFMGRDCEVWEISKLNTKVWLYKYISLKSISNIVGEIVIEATKIDENASVPAEKFIIPKDIKITKQKFTGEEKKMSEEMMKMMQNGEFDLEKIQKIMEQQNKATEEEESKGKK